MSDILNEQYILQLRGVFNIFDVKQEGLITVEHFQNIGRDYFGRHEDIDGVIEMLDPDATGKISFDSFCEGILSIVQANSNSISYNDVKNEDMVAVETIDEDRISCGTQETPSEFSNSTFNEYDMTDEDTSRYSTLERQNAHNALQDFEDKYIRKDDETDSAIVVGSVTMESPDIHAEMYFDGTGDGDEKFEDYGENEQRSGNFDYVIDELSESTLSPRKSLSACENCKKCLHLPRRDSWLHSSFRRSPGSNRRLPSTSALASQLFKAGSTSTSFSRHGSFESEDMHSEMSLEDDVIDLSHQVQKLQKQVTTLAENQANSEDKSARLKQENAALFARNSMLEEQIRELEIKSEERLREEQKRHKDALTRCDREKNQVVESYLMRIQSLETERQELKEELSKLRIQLDKTKQEKYTHQEKLSELEFSFTSLNEEHKKLQELSKREHEDFAQEIQSTSQLLDVCGKELEDLRKYKIENEPFIRCRSPSFLELPQRYKEQEAEIRKLKEENNRLFETIKENEAQVFNSAIKEGQRILLHSPSSNSLAAELEVLSKDEIMEKLHESQDVNQKLRDYVDKMLLNILEKSPQLLEVNPSGSFC